MQRHNYLEYCSVNDHDRIPSLPVNEFDQDMKSTSGQGIDRGRLGDI